MDTTRRRLCIESKMGRGRGGVTRHSESEAGMLSFSESFGEKICKLLSSLNIKHLDPLLFNAPADGEIAHCNMLGLLVIHRALSKAERAFVVTKKGSFFNMKTDKNKRILDKTHFMRSIRQHHELSVLAMGRASNQVNHPTPPGDGSPIDHQNHARCRLKLAVIQLTSPVCIRKSTHNVWELTGETGARVENTTKDRSKLMVVQKCDEFHTNKPHFPKISHLETSGQGFDLPHHCKGSCHALSHAKTWFTQHGRVHTKLKARNYSKKC